MGEGFWQVREEISKSMYGAEALQILDILSYFAPQIIDTDIFLSSSNSKEELRTAIKLLERYNLIQFLETEIRFRVEESIKSVTRTLLRNHKREKEVLKHASQLLVRVKDPSYSGSVRSVMKYLENHDDLSALSIELLNLTFTDMATGNRLNDDEMIHFTALSDESSSSTQKTQHDEASSTAVDAFSESLNVSKKQTPLQGYEILNKINETAMADKFTGIQQSIDLIDNLKLVTHEADRSTSYLALENCSEYSEFHLDTLRNYRNIGLLLYEQQKYDAAWKILEIVSLKTAGVLGKSHPETLETMINLATVLSELGKYQGALDICLDVHKEYIEAPGEQSIECLSIKYLIGDILFKQGKLHEAEVALQDAFGGFRNVLGPNNSMTASVKSTLELVHTASRKELKSIHWLAEVGDLNGVISYIEKGSDVNEKDYKGRTPLHYAASNGHINVAVYLFEKSAMYNVRDYGGETPLQLSSNRATRKLFYLVKDMFKYVKKGDVERVAYYLIEHPYTTKVQNKIGRSLLYWAVCYRHKTIVNQLLEAGADVSLVSSKGETLLHVACLNRDREIAAILLGSVSKDVSGKKFEDLINAKTEIVGSTALHIAVQNDDLDMATLLLVSTAVIKDRILADVINTHRSIDGDTPLHIAAKNNNLDMCQLLLGEL